MSDVTLLLPIAGRSSRYPGMQPKWMLMHPHGKFMLTEAIRGLDPKRFNRLIIVALRAHEEDYHFGDILIKEIGETYRIDKEKIQLVLLEHETKSQPETIYEGIVRGKVEGRILIKDSDNYFYLTDEDFDTNFVATTDLREMGSIQAANKSYAQLDEQGSITEIVEKKVISNFFCCGGYFIKNAGEFCQYFEMLTGQPNLFVSHVIQRMITDGHIFQAAKGKNFEDWGTLKDWLDYKNSFAAFFIELDGIVVLDSTEHFAPKWGTTEGLRRNVAIINRLYESGKVEIIVITSRKEAFRKITEEQLKKNGVKFHRIIMELPTLCRRFLVSNFSKDNPYASAISINLRTNEDRLDELLLSL